jgi:CRISPR-associated protein Csd1
VGDASTVCWAERDTEFDPVLAEIFGQHDNPDEGVQAVAMLFEAFKSGRFDGTEGETMYYVLGLAPNAARISVRFFHRLKIRDLAPRILQHFTDLQIAHGPNEPDHPSLFRLLAACAVQGKADNIPPNLGGAVIDAMLAGPDAPTPACGSTRDQPLPRRTQCGLPARRRHQGLPQSFHPSQPEGKGVSPHARPRQHQRRLSPGPAVCRPRKNPGRSLARLNATIRDRYYGAASSTPVAVFTTLLRLKNAHLKKLSPGRAVNFEKLLGEVLSSVTDFPPIFRSPTKAASPSATTTSARPSSASPTKPNPTRRNNNGSHQPLRLRAAL